MSVRPNFRAMAEFRYQIRRFLRFSETAARQAGIEPQQHQLLMAVKGLPEGLKPTISVLAERMQLQRNPSNDKKESSKGDKPWLIKINPRKNYYLMWRLPKRRAFINFI